ncbi:related to X-Pro aminopeptidase II [Melanopsichium pennsylvanicum]|uniref:Related to X-Pro aminopeptidase II n=2 Tax=Melanopsichium pennsylvanicum TaxID=63383 RepID=A0AAJ5C872_9BASI|nr:related to X-Pro aminopeptidase II [Melanopsichium pennsylvanicum 4]SNX87676.1 related to X-Pro aminopeptidase II [Melanopsichium pennsylvanicum]
MAASLSRGSRSLFNQLSRSSRTLASSNRAASSAARPTDDVDPYNLSGSASSSSCSSASSSSNLGRKRNYGQPLPHSHPHLFPRRGVLGSEDAVLRPGDALPSSSELYDVGTGIVATEQLTPGIPKTEYEDRRKALMDRLSDSSVVVAMSGRVKSMSGNIFYKFRQETNFWYLTGFQEPDAAVVLEKDASNPRGYKMTMFVQKRDEHNETWNGPRTGLDGAVDVFGADESYELEPAILLNHLKQILPKYTHIYVEPPNQPTTPRRGNTVGSKAGNILNYLAPPSTTSLDLFSKKSDFDAVVKLLGDTRKCHSLAREVERLRFKKSVNEIRVMRRAGKASGEAMAETMGFVRPGVSEAQLQAVFEYECALRGSQRPAYVPVVASGSNALTIHYVNNDRLVGPDQLVCIDAGGELDGYASDITRAFPCNADGRFSEPQKDLYTAVLNVLKSCTALASENQCYTLADLHRRSVDFLRQELKQIGFNLTGGTLERVLYPHYIGHWLGIDLHDCSSVERTTKLESGVVVTIEPGVYVPLDDAFPKHFQGIGIRVEDDIAVGEQDNVVLSSTAPKEVVDVEAACKRYLDRKHTSQEANWQPSIAS